jgi:hypothetical protein
LTVGASAIKTPGCVSIYAVPASQGISATALFDSRVWRRLTLLLLRGRTRRLWLWANLAPLALELVGDVLGNGLVIAVRRLLHSSLQGLI